MRNRGIAGRWRAGFAGQKWSSLREKKEFRDEFFELAICDFERNLEKLRKLYPVKTICMHGSPLSKWDNRDLWKKYDYRDFGIIAEPYFDLDFDEVFYLTDTGRRWDGSSVSVRDKVSGQLTKRRDGILSPGMNRMNRMIPAGLDGKNKRDEWMEPLGRMNRTIRMVGWKKTPQLNTLEGDPVQRGKEFRDLKIRHTWDIILAAERGVLPDRIMINTHPQRWDDRFGPWVWELVWQNFKNVVKRIKVLRFKY